MSVPLSSTQFGSPNKPIRTMPVRRVRISKLFPTQATYDDKKVAAMAAKEPDDISTLPIVGRRGDGGYGIMDGHHRLTAAAARGDTYAKVRIPR